MLTTPKVSDHHAIIPTATRPQLDQTEPGRAAHLRHGLPRLLQAWHDEHIWRVTTVITAITNPGIVDKYLSSGTAVEQIGWKILDLVPEKKSKKAAGAEDDESKSLPPGLIEGQPSRCSTSKP
jgi:DNA topoisomerase-3